MVCKDKLLKPPLIQKSFFGWVVQVKCQPKHWQLPLCHFCLQAFGPSSKKHGDSGRCHPALWGCKFFPSMTLTTITSKYLCKSKVHIDASRRLLAHSSQFCRLCQPSLCSTSSPSSPLSPSPSPSLSSRVWGRCPSSPHISSTSEYTSSAPYWHNSFYWSKTICLPVCLSVCLCHEGRRPFKRSKYEERQFIKLSVWWGSCVTHRVPCLSSSVEHSKNLQDQLRHLLKWHLQTVEWEEQTLEQTAVLVGTVKFFSSFIFFYFFCTAVIFLLLCQIYINLLLKNLFAKIRDRVDNKM